MTFEEFWKEHSGYHRLNEFEGDDMGGSKEYDLAVAAWDAAIESQKEGLDHEKLIRFDAMVRLFAEWNRQALQIQQKYQIETKPGENIVNEVLNYFLKATKHG